MLEAMSLNLDARAFQDLLADPAAAEVLSAVTGTPLVIVEVGDAAAARSLALLDITGLPAVVLAVIRDPLCLPAAAFPAAVRRAGRGARRRHREDQRQPG
jgi:hypothetical protein